MNYRNLISIAQKAVNEWRNDHTFYQAGQLVDSLCKAVETLMVEGNGAQKATSGGHPGDPDLSGQAVARHRQPLGVGDRVRAVREAEGDLTMDYKELITKFRQEADCIRRNNFADWADGFDLGSTAIETLMVERDTAMEDLRKVTNRRCRFCAHQNCRVKDFPCFSCKDNGGFEDYWEWRGPQKDK